MVSRGAMADSTTLIGIMGTGSGMPFLELVENSIKLISYPTVFIYFLFQNVNKENAALTLWISMDILKKHFMV